jgi:hypothetical protein
MKCYKFIEFDIQSMASGMAQVAENQPHKCKALSSTPVFLPKNNNKKGIQSNSLLFRRESVT